MSKIVLVYLLNLGKFHTHFSGVSIAKVEQVNFDWVKIS